MRDGMQILFERLLDREGGFVDHPADRGGPTNMGITLRALSDWMGREATVDELRGLSREAVHAIYRSRYWNDPRFYWVEHDFPEVLLELLLDMSVHHGPSTTIRILQRIIGVQVDGILGAVTAGAARQKHPGELMADLVKERLELFGEIISDDPSQAAFALGWMRRVGEFVLHIPRLSE